MNNIKVNEFKVLTDSVEVDKKIKDAIDAIPPSVTEAKVKQVIQTDVPPMITARLTDYATKTDLGTKADKATTYTKTQVDNLIATSEGKIIGENRIKEIIKEDVPAIVDGRISGLATKAEVNLKADKASVYTISQTYSKEEVYPKTETYKKDEVYSKLQTYTKQEIDNKIAGGGGGGGAGATVTDFRVDPSDPFNLEIHLSDGTIKSERLLDMHKEYLRGYTVSATSILRRVYDDYIWKERLALNQEFNFPLKVWDDKKRKGNCQVLTESGYDYVRYPEGDLQLTFKMDVDTRWRPFGEKNPNPITGDFQRVYRAYVRPIGGTAWTLSKEATFDWTYTNPYTEASFVFRTPSLVVVSPSTPFEIRFAWAFTKMGNDPSDLLANDLRFGLDNMNGSPNEGGISITTKKLVVEQWYDYD